MFRDLTYRITFRCNKRCYFCYNRSFGNTVDYQENEVSNIKPLIYFISDNKIPRISITGGEPSMRKDLPTIIYQINEVCKVKIFTNGALFKRFSNKNIMDFELDKIVYTITDEDIYQNIKEFKNLCKRITELRSAGCNIDGNLFLDDTFFKKRNQAIALNLKEVFNNIRWQPLVLPKKFKNYSITIFGMDENLRKKIFEQVISDNWGDTDEYYKVFEEFISMGKQSYPCMFPKYTCTVNPDLSLRICPHKNDKLCSFKSIDKTLLTTKFDNCLSARCISIYKFK